MSIPPYTFGMSEFTTWPWSFERDVAAYATWYRRDRDHRIQAGS